MNPIIVTTVLSLTRLVTEMAINWDNPNYTPPSPDELEALANQIEALPDLPERD